MWRAALRPRCAVVIVEGERELKLKDNVDTS
jgi:hypothetical protein